MIVDGENLSNSQVRRLIEMVNKDAKEIAGQFFDQCRKGLLGDGGRAEKFRAFWTEIGFRCGRDPQDCYVESQYEHFIEDVREQYCNLLQRPDVKEADKRLMHQAIIVQTMLGIHSQRVPVQVKRDSQQFVGDRFETKQIAETYGAHAEPSLVDKLMASSNLTRH